MSLPITSLSTMTSCMMPQPIITGIPELGVEADVPVVTTFYTIQPMIMTSLLLMPTGGQPMSWLADLHIICTGWQLLTGQLLVGPPASMGAQAAHPEGCRLGRVVEDRAAGRHQAEVRLQHWGAAGKVDGPDRLLGRPSCPGPKPYFSRASVFMGRPSLGK